jgi:hypothetical protein
MDLSAWERLISPQEREKRFRDRSCLYCGGINHSAADFTSRKKAQTLKRLVWRLRKLEPKTVPRNRDKIQSTHAGWPFGRQRMYWFKCFQCFGIL